LDFLGRGSLADALARRLACGPCVRFLDSAHAGR
jgi:hypothetical protein